MTKDDSILIKGVAILLMLFLHLFNRLENVDICSNLLYLGNTPMVYLLTRATNPVAFFLILGGYGLYVVESENKNYGLWKKVINLFVHYWIAMLIFVAIGAFVVGMDKYPGGIVDVIENVTAFHPTWNGETWFLFPYLLLVVSSRYLFQLIDKVNVFVVLIIAFVLYRGAAWCIINDGNLFGNHTFAYMPIYYCYVLFSFLLGAVMAKYSVCDILGKYRVNGICY